ncbi:MAG: amidinotransferase [Sphingobacteriales bacterium]|nr:amidinotransferase [Sphingobacteriales bacterium]
MQTTSHILMIRPVNFAFNSETAESNVFQVNQEDAFVQQRARQEFDSFVKILSANGIDVTVVEDSPQPYTPDSIFPNNWISFHDDGTIILYPMFASKRRMERKKAVFTAIAAKFNIKKITDLSKFENENIFLEGTGSMVLDRENKIAYACLSNRTHPTALEAFSKESGYSIVVFNSFDAHGMAIYHTNVMMCVADKYVVICNESIKNKEEKKLIEQKILLTGKEIIAITFEQLNHFAGNMLQVENKHGEKILVMSTQAYESLSGEQIATLSAYNRIIHSPIPTIETNGGGSARCMMAEIFLSLNNA